MRGIIVFPMPVTMLKSAMNINSFVIGKYEGNESKRLAKYVCFARKKGIKSSKIISIEKYITYTFSIYIIFKELFDY